MRTSVSSLDWSVLLWTTCLLTLISLLDAASTAPNSSGPEDALWQIETFEATCYGEWYNEKKLVDWHWTEWSSPQNELITKDYVAKDKTCTVHKNDMTWTRQGVVWTKNPHWFFYFSCRRRGNTTALACCPDLGGVIKIRRTGVDLSKDPDYGVLRSCHTDASDSGTDTITSAEQAGLKTAAGTDHEDKSSADAAE